MLERLAGFALLALTLSWILLRRSPRIYTKAIEITAERKAMFIEAERGNDV